ncbi:epithelial membrane protein 3 [Latimeria chalumnae]|uniref:Epithelial membrane protein 3 (MAM blood group) n=1 Tax=Latimeria chalumnae TaxID=7897 RepID=H3A0U4_LATCH|nr:PREDICTED: epithelial membrane protein 3 [Latimeria chalumnae]|eukprot:XP_006009718.1 PREDICTED: epithelial membrane protein 3 [Latimeria chalumnae]
MTFLLFGILTLHLIVLVLLYLATLEKAWWVSEGSYNENLWYDCHYNNDTDTWLCATASENEWRHAVQALMVLSVLFSSISFILFLCQLFTLKHGGLFYVTGIFQIFAGLADFTGAVIYAAHVQDFLKQTGGHFGYCFVLAWVAFPLSLASGVLYIHLRKRD